MCTTSRPATAEGQADRITREMAKKGRKRKQRRKKKANHGKRPNAGKS
jgi:hypothetical protein